MKLQILSEAANRFYRMIEKLVTFRFIELVDELFQSIEHCAVHVIFVGVEANAENHEIRHDKFKHLAEGKLTCIDRESSA